MQYENRKIRHVMYRQAVRASEHLYIRQNKIEVAHRSQLKDVTKTIYWALEIKLNEITCATHMIFS